MQIQFFFSVTAKGSVAACEIKQTSFRVNQRHPWMLLLAVLTVLKMESEKKCTLSKHNVPY